MKYAYLLILLMLASCAATRPVNIPDDAIYNDWQITGGALPGELLAAQPLVLSLADKFNSHIDMGCDTLKFTPRYWKGDQIEIKNPSFTELRSCANDPLAAHLKAAFGRVAYYDLNDQELVLKSRTGEKLIIAHKKQVVLHKKWMVKKLGNVAYEKLLAAQAYMDFSTPGSVSAHFGCNGMGMNYILKGNTIKLTNPMGTLMYCEGKMEAEEAFAAIVNKIAKYHIQGHFLSFLDKNNSLLMQLVAEDWD